MKKKLMTKIKKGDKLKLFNLLIKFGFVKNITQHHIMFEKDNELLIYPKTKLEVQHFASTRYQLDMNGHISKKEFTLMFDFLIE